MRILVTGATGYVGGRLIPRLLEAGHEVTALVRDAGRVGGREWSERVTLLEGDLLDGEGAWMRQVEGFDVAFYLVHAIGSGAGFRDRERQMATHFIKAVRGVGKVIYLGGLLPEDGQEASDHLTSRAETGRLLREALPTTEFRAGPVIGSGSASFEMVRYLTERLPVMLTPKWVDNPVQPIAIREVLSYLMAALERPPLGVVEIGMEPQSFADMMQLYAKERGLRRRWIVRLPVLTPRVAARWIGWITPLSNRIAVPLVEGIVHPLCADRRKAQEHFPEVEVADYPTAVRRALRRIERSFVETRFSDSLGSAPTYEMEDREGMISETCRIEVDAPAEALFSNFMALGGERGWLVFNWAWRLRGTVDSLIGGPGLRRGRRDPRTLHPGESVDFWRVVAVEPPSRLLLRAEMKVPGQGWLELLAAPAEDAPETRSMLTLTALYRPRGLRGLLYWYLSWPIHKLLFPRLARALRDSTVAQK